MSPSQWQLSGSCLPLLCSLVHTLRMPHFKEDLKIQVRNQNENAGTVQPITIFPQFGWGVYGESHCVCNGWNCLFERLRFEGNQQNPAKTN